MAALLYRLLFFSLFHSGALAPEPPRSAPIHPFYVSVTEINHNKAEKSLEISCKIFAEDLEDILKKNYKTTVDLSDASREAQNNKLVSDYIQKHLLFSINGKPVKLAFVGFEKESESAYGYFEIPGVSSLKKLDVSNSILHDFIDSQINILHITVSGNRKSYKLDFPKTQASFNF